MFTQKGVLPFLLGLLIISEIGGALMARGLKPWTRRLYFIFTVALWVLSIGHFGLYYFLGPKRILFITGGILFAVLLAVVASKIIWTFWGILGWLVEKVSRKNPPTEARRRALVQIGGIIASAPAWVMAYGMGWGRVRFTLHHVELSFPTLPQGWDGVRILQFSDLHAGSFFTSQSLLPVWETIQNQKPDLILFTGDWINHMPQELDPFLQDLAALQAPLGKWAILGNHDYGDYIPRISKAAKAALQARLREKIEGSGFTLLHNASTPLSRQGDVIYLAGMGYWGYRWRFQSYGDLEKTLQDIPPQAFTILLTHDPSHWHYQVLGKKDIPLTLSGHTHGLQMGIEMHNWRFSPAQYLYRYWAGLYQEGKQFIYVNRGLGYVGLPARVGIWPEVTLFTLRKGTAFESIQTRSWIGLRA